MFKDKKIKFSLEILASRYNYNHWIYNNIRNYIGQNILEVGAGIGNISDFLMFKKQITLLDVEPTYVDYLKQKYGFRKPDSLKIYNQDISAKNLGELNNRKYDTIILLNTLEHIKDEKQTMQNMAKLCVPGGKIIILVPALQSIYGSTDKAFGHYRRYNKNSLLKLIKPLADLKIKKIYYMNFLGIFGWFLNGKVLKNKYLPEKQTRIFDILVPFIGLLEKIIKPPIGQSLIAIFEKQK